MRLLIILLFASLTSNAQIRLGDLNVKGSISGSEKIPVSGSGNPAITPNLLRTYILGVDSLKIGDGITASNFEFGIIAGEDITLNNQSLWTSVFGDVHSVSVTFNNNLLSGTGFTATGGSIANSLIISNGTTFQGAGTKSQDLFVGSNHNYNVTGTNGNNFVSGSTHTVSGASLTGLAIIGGASITGDASNTVFMPKVRVGLGTGGSLTTDNTNFNVIVRDGTSGELEINTTITSGTYTPTLTNVANLDASTAFECQYMRIGTVVHVSGKVSIDPTSTTTLTQLGISLPVASDLDDDEDCSGTAFASGIAGQGAAIVGDVTNDRAELVFISGDVTDQPMYFTFTYQVL